MTAPSPVLVEIWRGDMLECVHRGMAVVCRPSGEVVAAWGDPARVILPRSSVKILQALALVESGAAKAAGLGPEQLALASASHQGAAIHTRLVRDWLASLGLGEADLRCGPQVPDDSAERFRLRTAGERPDQTHNNCSGKHAGFLTLARHLGAGPDYIDPDHPVQKAVAAAIAETGGEEIGRHAIDGCSAPNFAMSLAAIATAMARLARPAECCSGVRARAAQALREAMAAHPLLVAGEKRACTDLIRAASGGTVVKTGAEGVFTAILPEQGLGVALKIDDGATRASEAAMTALLVRLGALPRDHPVVAARGDAVQRNRRGIETGRLRAVADLFG